MDKEKENKDIYIAVGIDDSGNLKVVTEEEFLPIDVINMMLNKVYHDGIKQIAKMKDTDAEDVIRYYKKERRNWMVIAFVSLFFAIYVLLKAKGVL